MVSIVYLFQVTCLSIMCSVHISPKVNFQHQAVLVYNLNVFPVNTIFCLANRVNVFLPVLKSYIIFDFLYYLAKAAKSNRQVRDIFYV